MGINSSLSTPEAGITQSPILTVSDFDPTPFSIDMKSGLTEDAFAFIDKNV